MSGTLYNKLDLINNAKQDIKASLINMGQNATNDITTYGNLISNISSIPNGIFIQENQPTKTTDEALWLEEDTVLLQDLIPLNTPISTRTFQAALNALTAEQAELFNTYTYITYVNNSSYARLEVFNTYVYQNNSFYATDGMYYDWYNNNWNTITSNRQILPNYTAGDWLLNKDLISPSLIIKANIEDTEAGVHIDVDNTRYIAHINKSNSWNKILDTSDANANASDILTGKTAYKNNTKITGTMNNLGDLSIIPNTTGGTISSGFVNSINISAISNAIEPNLISEYIANGVNIFGVTGNLSASEDLSNELNAQNLVIANLENQVNVLSNTLNNATQGKAELPVGTLFGRSTFVDAPYFDTSNYTNMAFMFAECKNLVNVPNYNTSNVNHMGQMFYNCISLADVPLMNWSNLLNAENVFWNCSNLSANTYANIANMLPLANKLQNSNSELSYLGLNARNFDFDQLAILSNKGYSDANPNLYYDIYYS